MTKHIALAGLGTFALVFVDETGKSVVPYISLLLAFVIIAVIGEASPQLGGAFAYLIFVVALLERGPRVFKKVGG